MDELSYTEVAEILAIVGRMDVSSATVQWGDLRIEVSDIDRRSRAVESAPSPEPSPVREQSAGPAGTSATSRTSQDSLAVASAEGRARPEESDVPAHWVAVKAPMVGTCYRSPSPGEPSFVDVGDVVEPGTTVALVEVMKLFTEVKAEKGGKVARVVVEDGALVDYGAPLLWIEPA